MEERTARFVLQYGMGQQLPAISAQLEAFIAKQTIFFVATAAATGRVNVSPKGMDSLRVLGPNRVAWLNSTGSGNESAAHVLQNPRMTLMFCALEGPPLVLRLYGTARAHHAHDPEWPGLLALFGPDPAVRQVFTVEVDLVQTSCGMAVPFFDHVAERDDLRRHWAGKSEADLLEYRKRKNLKSLDGFETGLLAGDAE